MWNEEKISFIKEHFPTKGSRFCANELGFEIRQIRSKVQYLGLKKLPPIMMEDFISIIKPEVSYFLGFLWADGCVYNNKITVECKKEDIEVIEETFDSVARWNKYVRNRGYSDVKILDLSSKELKDFLIENDYKKKSGVSPDKILNKIPTELRHYFHRGYLDGDGGFYFNPELYLRNINFSSVYDQDWGFLENLCIKLGITTYSISRRESKNGNKQSSFRITNKKSIKIFGDYIYDGKSFGLERKKQKFLEMVVHN